MIGNDTHDDHHDHGLSAHLRHQPSEPRAYTKDDIEEMLAVADLLGLEFDQATLSTLDPDRMTPAEAHMVFEIVTQRIREGWMREMVRQQKKAGRHGR